MKWTTFTVHYRELQGYHMFLSAKTFFEDHTAGNNMLLIRGATMLPAEFIRIYKKNVVKITPMKSGALRRSIITQSLGNEANISWRSAYAGAQNEGGHTVAETRRVNIDGRFVTLKPGFYRYRKYTTAGTGPHFANIAYQETVREMPAAARALGLIKS